MTIQFLCPACERSHVAPLPLPAGLWECPACSRRSPTYDPGRLEEGEPLARCAFCGGDRFYTQSDFSQTMGCLIVGVGAILSPFTFGLSLLICLGIDLVLYLLLKQVTVCYRCGSIYRGIRKHPGHGAFDLHVAAMVEEERKYLEPEKNG